jgi:hypothetical protein
MTDTSHEAPERMKTIRLTVDLTYDQEVMHGDEDEAISWFNSILAGKDLMLGDFGELGDMIGSVQVVSRSNDLVQAAVAAALTEAAVNLCTYAPHLEDGTEHDVGYYYGYHTALNRTLALLAAVESRSILGQHDGTLPDDLMEQIEATIREGSNERSEEGE